MSIFDPDKQTKQGGFLDDVDAVIIAARTKMHDFVKGDGTVVQENVPGLMLTLQAGDIKSDQFFSVGHADKLEATKDGKTFQALLGKDLPDGFADNSKGAELMRELKNLGFEGLAEVVNGNGGKGDFTALAGHAFHWKERVKTIQVKDKKNPGKKVAQEIRTLLPTKYLGAGKQAGGGAKAGAATAKRGSTAKAAPAPEPAEETADLDTRVAEIVNDVLSGEEGPITKLALQKKVVAIVDEDEDLKGQRRDVIRLLMSDDFLKGEHATWTFDGKTVSL